MEFDVEVVLFVLLRKKLKKNKRKHKFWMHILLNSRQESGMFYTAFNDIRNDESKFLKYFLMSTLSFDELLQHIRNDISPIKSSVSKLWPVM
jgi:translation initiation factor 2 alpha subunit (eIF-2alpha)